MKYIISVLLILLAISILFNIIQSCNANHIKTDTIYFRDTVCSNDTVVYRDTLEKTHWIPVKEEVIRRDTVLRDTVLILESKEYRDTLVSSPDTLYLKASISGINPSLDSIKYDWRRSVITNTVTITKYKERKRTWRDRISIGPSATVGYDPFNKQWGVTIGVGVSIDLCQ